MTATAAVKFKFKVLDDNGNETGFLSKKGSFDGETLVLDEATIPIVAILRAQRRFNRLVLTLLQQDGTTTMAGVAITGGNLAGLMELLNQCTSDTWAQMRKDALAKEGRAGEFRSEACPYCQATLDLTLFPPTPQIYCSYCETVVTKTGTAPPDEKTFRVCERCGLYAQPKGFTTFYFIFLVVVFQWSYRRTYMCNACMRGEAWKMFFGNFLFILGLPFAIVQLVRAYFGGSSLSRSFAGLDKANALAKRGKIEASAAEYELIEGRLTHCAGVKYNRGVAHETAGQSDDAATHLGRALDDCANYTPAYNALCAVFEKLGRTAELNSLRKRWGADS